MSYTAPPATPPPYSPSDYTAPPSYGQPVQQQTTVTVVAPSVSPSPLVAV